MKKQQLKVKEVICCCTDSQWEAFVFRIRRACRTFCSNIISDQSFIKIQIDPKSEFMDAGHCTAAYIKDIVKDGNFKHANEYSIFVVLREPIKKVSFTVALIHDNGFLSTFLDGVAVVGDDFSITSLGNDYKAISCLHSKLRNVNSEICYSDQAGYHLVVDISKYMLEQKNEILKEIAEVLSLEDSNEDLSDCIAIEIFFEKL